MLLADAVHIWREPEGEYHLDWDVSAPDTQVSVTILDSPGTEVFEHREGRNGGRVTGLPLGRRHFFSVSDQHGTEIVASERRFGMEGAPNFRDFGGYPTTNGRRVKWGYLFRSGQLSNLTDHDIGLLASLKLDLVCDFRRVEEQEGDPSKLPAQRPPRIASLPIVPGSNSRFFEEADAHLAQPEAMSDFMREINRDFAAEQTETYARMFKEIFAQPDSRFLVHCAAGKDRTGFAAAIVLLALGVSREIVMQDYLLTRQFFIPDREIERLRVKYDMEHMNAEVIRPMLEVHDHYLQQAFAVIDRDYPSLEVYLEEALGVGKQELQELRRRYLE